MKSFQYGGIEKSDGNGGTANHGEGPSVGGIKGGSRERSKFIGSGGGGG